MQEIKTQKNFWIERYKTKGKDGIASGGTPEQLLKIAKENITDLFCQRVDHNSKGCDYGCGYGRLIPFLLEYCTSLLACDINPRILQDAKISLIHQTQVSFMSPNTFFTSKSLRLDWIFTYTVAQHFMNQEFWKTLSIFKKHLKKGGLWLGVEYMDQKKESEYMNRCTFEDYKKGFSSIIIYKKEIKVAPVHPLHTAFILQKP